MFGLLSYAIKTDSARLKVKKSKEIMGSLVRELEAKFFYNPLLREGSNDYRIMVNRCFEAAGNSNEKYRELNSFIKPIHPINFHLLELFRGYRRLS